MTNDARLLVVEQSYHHSLHPKSLQDYETNARDDETLPFSLCRQEKFWDFLFAQLVVPRQAEL